MKITKSTINRLIKEELQGVLDQLRRAGVRTGGQPAMIDVEMTGPEFKQWLCKKKVFIIKALNLLLRAVQRRGPGSDASSGNPAEFMHYLSEWKRVMLKAGVGHHRYNRLWQTLIQMSGYGADSVRTDNVDIGNPATSPEELWKYGAPAIAAIIEGVEDMACN